MSYEGDLLKSLRKRKNMTQKQFSEYLEIPLITLAQWECEKRTPPKYVLNLIKDKIEREEYKIARIVYCTVVTSKIHGTYREFCSDFQECDEKVKFWNNQNGYSASYEIYEQRI